MQYSDQYTKIFDNLIVFPYFLINVSITYIQVWSSLQLGGFDLSFGHATTQT